MALFLTLAHDSNEKQEQGRASETQQAAQQSVGSVARPERNVEADYYEPDCDRPDGPQAADLCAQLRMASAAERQVFWLGFQTFLLAFTLLAATAAAIYARAAARQAGHQVKTARDANRISREIARESRRAWMAIESCFLVPSTLLLDDASASSRITTLATAKNLGDTPAFSAELTYAYHFEKSDPPFGTFRDEFVKSLRQKPRELGRLVFPNDTMPIREHRGIVHSDFKESIRTNKDGSQIVLVNVLVGVSYRIAGDDNVHITHETFVARLKLPFGIAGFGKNDQAMELQTLPFLAGLAD